MNYNFNYSNPPREYKENLERLLNKYPYEDKLYYWLAEPFIERREYNKAKEIINKGFFVVKNRSLLATTMAEINLMQSNPIAIGWYLQACLLATINFVAYKCCAVVAKEVGNNNLYWRLYNAGDVIEQKYSPEKENKIREIVYLMNQKELIKALNIFERNMAEFLPKSDDIPKDRESRDVFILLGKNSNSGYTIKARLKLLRIDL